MNDKTREQIEAMKNQTIGVEVEMNRSAGTGKPVKKTKEKRARRIRLFQGVVRRRPPQFIAIIYHTG